MILCACLAAECVALVTVHQCTECKPSNTHKKLMIQIQLNSNQTFGYARFCIDITLNSKRSIPCYFSELEAELRLLSDCRLLSWNFDKRDERERKKTAQTENECSASILKINANFKATVKFMTTRSQITLFKLYLAPKRRKKKKTNG